MCHSHRAITQNILKKKKPNLARHTFLSPISLIIRFLFILHTKPKPKPHTLFKTDPFHFRLSIQTQKNQNQTQKQKKQNSLVK